MKRRTIGMMAGAVAAAASAGTIALAGGARPEPPPSALWPADPGRPLAPSLLVRKVAALSGVDARSLREVVSAGSEERELVLIWGRTQEASSCFAVRGLGTVNEFTCLDRGPMGRALALGSMYSGVAHAAPDHATVVGVARQDIHRITITTAAGMSVELPLGKWGEFSYVAEAADQLPRQLTALSRDGRVIESMPMSP